MHGERAPNNGGKEYFNKGLINIIYQKLIYFVYQINPAGYQEAQVVVSVLSSDVDGKLTSTTTKQVYFIFDLVACTCIKGGMGHLNVVTY